VAVHSSKAGILGRIAARSLGLPALLTAHGWNFTPGISAGSAAIFRRIERWAGPLAARIITVSEYDRQLALEAGLTTADRVVTVHNGMPDIPAALRARPEREPVRLVMVARFGEQKDHPTLLRALGELRELPWELDLIGDGPLMGRMQAMARSLGLDGRVRFLGQRLDVDQLLAQAQVSLLVTNWEGFPLSILEAMRAGLPVVATAVAGIGEAVIEGESGYLIARGDVATLKDRIRRLLTDPMLRSRFGQGGRACYEQHFTKEHFVSRTLAVYREVLAERGAPLPRERLSDRQVASGNR
jgi:glycosyltransferase involved in cell wall biosynthesis